MAGLDAQWAGQEIDQFLQVTAQVSPNQSGSGVYYMGSVMRGSQSAASEAAVVVEQILDRVLPAGWASGRPNPDNKYRWLRDQASRAKALLKRADEIAQRLGDGAPEMNASALHEWAWDSGKAFWHTGHFHQAVMQAAIRVNAETQNKVGRKDVSETKLFNEVFSLESPKVGAPRLRLMKDDSSDTYKNLHRGAARWQRDFTPLFVTLACTSLQDQRMSTWRWNSWLRSAFLPAGLIRPTSQPNRAEAWPGSARQGCSVSKEAGHCNSSRLAAVGGPSPRNKSCGVNGRLDTRDSLGKCSNLCARWSTGLRAVPTAGPGVGSGRMEVTSINELLSEPVGVAHFQMVLPLHVQLPSGEFRRLS